MKELHSKDMEASCLFKRCVPVGYPLAITTRLTTLLSPLLTAPFASATQHELERLQSRVVYLTAARSIAESKMPMITARERNAPADVEAVEDCRGRAHRDIVLLGYAN